MLTARRRIPSALVAVGLIVLAACGRDDGSQPKIVASLGQQPSPAQPSEPDQRLEAIAPAMNLTPIATAASRTAGVWSWTIGPDSALVSLTDPNGNVKTWPLVHPANGGLAAGAAAGLGEAPDGTVWMAASLRLLRLDPRTGATKDWQIPAPAVSALVSAARPASVADTEYVQALSFSPQGDVLLAIAGANSIVVFEPTKETFRQIALPDIGEAQDVAMLPDGTLAVAMSDYTTHRWDSLVLQAPNGKQKVVKTDSYFVRATRGHFVSGFYGLNSVSVDGSITPVTLPEGSKANPRIRPDVLPDGRVVIGDTGKITGHAQGSGV